MVTKHCETENEIEVHLEIQNTSCNCVSCFTWSDIKWELQYKSVDKSKQLYLAVSQGSVFLPVVFKFGILLVNGRTETRCCLTKYFRNSSKCFGTQEFILESEILERKHEITRNGILTLFCSIAHLSTLIKPQKLKYEKLDVLSSNLKSVYGSTTNSDMIILVGEQKYPVHKVILEARSDVFAAMFRHDVDEVKSRIIKVTDCDPSAFNDFLLYLYTGKVENFTSSNAFHLYKIADKYNVEELKRLCVQYIRENISITNIFEIIIFAHQYDETELRSIAEEFFRMNALVIIKGDNWEQFVKQNFSIANELLINVLKDGKTD